MTLCHIPDSHIILGSGNWSHIILGSGNWIFCIESMPVDSFFLQYRRGPSGELLQKSGGASVPTKWE